MNYPRDIEIELEDGDRTIAVLCTWNENERGSGYAVEIATDKETGDIVELTSTQEYEAQHAATLKEKRGQTMDFE